MKTKNLLSWVFRLIAAGVLVQTLYFKFTAHPDSVYIFSQLGMEPWGRIGTGVAELVISILLIVPRTAWLGALGGLGIISGALMAHLTQLGVEVQGDGGTLFILAVVVFVSCLIVLFLHRAQAVSTVRHFLKRA
ncbi:MAG TPA: DoxX family protein [Saprospiraceae bacterium]|nr:DoxX family protein [Saprospiraceae bacterium]HMQ85526.1 DoxX family protein [Saprospiraceae bacterium]